MDEDIDFSDCPEITPEMFAKAIVQKRSPVEEAKTQVTLQIDSHVWDWFKSQNRTIKNKSINYYELIWKHINRDKISYCCLLSS